MDPFELPEDTEAISSYDVASIEDLEAAEEAAVTESQRLAAIENPSDAELDRLDALAEFVESVRSEGEARETAQAERIARRDAAAARIAPTDDSADDDADDDGPQGGDETDDNATGDDAPPAVDAQDGEPAPEAVAAAGQKRKRQAPSLIRRTKARQPANPQPSSGDERVTITASADIPDVQAGSLLDNMQAVTAAFQGRARSHPRSDAPNLKIKHQVATFSRGMGELDSRTGRADFRSDHQALLDFAGSEARLREETGKDSLAAAGGWCAPSTTLYDLIEMEQADGLVDVPEVGAPRGGLRFTTGPDFADIYAGSGFAQTEAQAIAGTTKDCYEVDCPDFDETRLDAVGICVKSPILTDHAYPELVRRTLNGVMVAHEHKKSARVIASMATELGTATTVPTYGSTFRNLLTGLELAAEGQRNARALGQNTTLEVVLPNWVKVALRDDLQARQRQANPVTDAQLAEHFAARGLRVQYVFHYGDARIVDPPGSNFCLSDFPDTVPAMLYPAGTFVKAVEDVISLSTMYDSTDLQTNVFTAAFAEEGLALIKRAPGGCNLVFTVDNSGSVGPADLPSWGITDA